MPRQRIEREDGPEDHAGAQREDEAERARRGARRRRARGRAASGSGVVACPAAAPGRASSSTSPRDGGGARSAARAGRGSRAPTRCSRPSASGSAPSGTPRLAPAVDRPGVRVALHRARRAEVLPVALGAPAAVVALAEHEPRRAAGGEHDPGALAAPGVARVEDAAGVAPPGRRRPAPATRGAGGRSGTSCAGCAGRCGRRAARSPHTSAPAAAGPPPPARARPPPAARPAGRRCGPPRRRRGPTPRAACRRRARSSAAGTPPRARGTSSRASRRADSSPIPTARRMRTRPGVPAREARLEDVEAEALAAQRARQGDEALRPDLHGTGVLARGRRRRPAPAPASGAGRRRATGRAAGAAARRARPSASRSRRAGRAATGRSSRGPRSRRRRSTRGSAATFSKRADDVASSAPVTPVSRSIAVSGVRGSNVTHASVLQRRPGGTVNVRASWRSGSCASRGRNPAPPASVYRPRRKGASAVVREKR